MTVLRLGPEHEAAVLEMGMYVGGEIADLARIARPRIGVVTAVQAVHLSRIGSLDAIEQAKGELLEALPPDGVAILNADDPIVRRMGARSAARAVSYGFAADADVGAEAVESAGLDGMRFVLRAERGRRTVTIPTLGRLSVHNALAGAAVGLAAGMTLDEIDAGLADGWSAPHRVAVVRLGGVTIVDDTYNASPRSVIAALDLLAGLPGRRARGARRDARARRRLATRATARSARRPPGPSTGWWSSGPGAAGIAEGRGGRDGPGSRSTGCATPTPRWTCCRHDSATATSSWSRRRAASRSIPSSTASAASSAAGRRADDRRAHPGPPPGVRSDGHPHVAVHPRPPRARVRQADPPGGPGEPLRQGGDADDGRPPHRRRSSSASTSSCARDRTRRRSRRWRHWPASARWAPSTTT